MGHRNNNVASDEAASILSNCIRRSVDTGSDVTDFTGTGILRHCLDKSQIKARQFRHQGLKHQRIEVFQCSLGSMLDSLVIDNRGVFRCHEW